jgi:hypothetical protein
MITIHLPIRTVSEANGRGHWSVKAKRAKEHRAVAGLMTASRLVTAGWLSHWLFDRICLIATLTRIAPRELDCDNLRSALKSVRDGVADAIGINDRDPRVAWEYGQRRGKAREYAVEVTVEKKG